jgi:hypothetical protein
MAGRVTIWQGEELVDPPHTPYVCLHTRWPSSSPERTTHAMVCYVWWLETVMMTQLTHPVSLVTFLVTPAPPPTTAGWIQMAEWATTAAGRTPMPPALTRCLGRWVVQSKSTLLSQTPTWSALRMVNGTTWWSAHWWMGALVTGCMWMV